MKKSIMPPDSSYSQEQTGYLHRHEVFFGQNRQTSLKYGLFVYLMPAMHNMSDMGVHFNHEFDLRLKRIGQRAAMNHYGWTVEQFVEIFGKNYLETECEEIAVSESEENLFRLIECYDPVF